MKIQLKRSNVLENNAAKEPTAAQMEYGELAVNYNTDDPAIFLKDSNDNIIRISGVNNISDDGQVEIPANPNPPSDPLAGNLWYNPVDGRLYIYYVDDNSSQWVDASPDSWQPTVIPNPENPASQPDTLDDRYVMVTGDNMTGDLTLGTDKITLNATDGSGEFAGEVLIGGDTNASSSDPGDGGLRFVKGTVMSNRTGPVSPTSYSNCFNGRYNGVNTSTLEADGTLKLGGTLPSAPNISLNADGTAVYNGSITYGGYDQGSTEGGGYSIQGYPQGSGHGGSLRVQNVAGANNYAAMQVWDGTTATANWRQDGTIDIGGTLTGGGGGHKPNITLNADGSARFGGPYIDITNDWDRKIDQNSARIAQGAFYSQRESVNPDASVFRGILSTTNGTTAPITSDIFADGRAFFTGTINGETVGTSDARFKENITPANPQLADVVALGGLLKNYDWNDDAPVNEEIRAIRQLGLVAQEVAEVCPSLVKDISRTKTIEITPAVIGLEGKVITEAVTSEVDDNYKGLSQGALIMKLIGAVAELSAEVQALKDAA